MAISSQAYDLSALKVDSLTELARETARLAHGRVPTQAVTGSEFWEVGRVPGDRSRRTQRSPEGVFEFWGNTDGDLVGLKPDGRLVEVRFSQSSSGSSFAPPPMQLGSFETRWEEGPFEANWHYEILDSANIGLPVEETRTGSWGVIHEERLEKWFVTIVDQRGRGLERALQSLQDMARRAIDAGESVPSASISPLTGGVYVRVDEASTKYLRFYADGQVIDMSSTGTPVEIANWFAIGRDEMSTGQYVSVGAHIEFVSRTSRGAVSYKGAFTSPTQLVLDSYSHINGYISTDRVFEFVELDFPA